MKSWGIGNMKFKKDNLHHAYICVGDREQVLESVLSFVEEDLGIHILGNPDVRVEKFENFGIDDARRINSAQLKRAVTGGKMIFITSLVGATVEAQNSLLKMFEEPTENTYFFIISETAEIFLPTLLSRVQIEEIKSVNNLDTDRFVKKFLLSTKAKRIDMLKEIIEEKDKGEALRMLNALERELYSTRGAKESDSYEVINLCRRYISGRGASVKILMEYLALNM
jgi:DNA polymerase III subunit delta'